MEKIQCANRARMENTVPKETRYRSILPSRGITPVCFPTIYLNYLVDKNHTLTVSYGRRINRPNYQDLNPFSVVS